MKKLTALFLALALFLTACGASPDGVESLMEDIPARAICLAEEPDGSTQATDFALRLFRASLAEDENTLISPLSVLSALAMTANGADGNTLTQMEAALGMSTDDLNPYLYSFMDSQSDQLKLANSIWFKDSEDLQVQPVFLETNADYYHADLFKTTFDADALKAINSWISEKTDGTIPKMLEELNPDAVMYLINALAFEAEWEEVYKDHQVRENVFTNQNGTQHTAEFMSSSEYSYLEDENATGFIKYYNGRNYAFVALLPNEGITVADYAASLTAEHLQALLENPQTILTYASIPKFETEFTVELSDALRSMGMTDAFDVMLADFSRLGTSGNGNIFISQVLHKTYISVAEQGTKAGAATVVEMAEGAALIEEYRRVSLDRPFLYLLIDCKENLPFFIGALMDVEG